MRQISEIKDKKQAYAELCMMNEELKRQQEELKALIEKARAVGTSWEAIGKAMDLSKQTAYNRYNGVTATDTSKIIAEDVAGASVTPSIFLEPAAPAKAKTATKSPFKPASRQHAAILPRGSKPITTHAQPGTGKGPHLCTGCGSNNHHGPRRGTIEWNDGCRPTKYDTQQETDYLNARNSK